MLAQAELAKPADMRSFREWLNREVNASTLYLSGHEVIALVQRDYRERMTAMGATSADDAHEFDLPLPVVITDFQGLMEMIAGSCARALICGRSDHISIGFGNCSTMASEVDIHRGSHWITAVWEIVDESNEPDSAAACCHSAVHPVLQDVECQACHLAQLRHARDEGASPKRRRRTSQSRTPRCQWRCCVAGQCAALPQQRLASL